MHGIASVMNADDQVDHALFTSSSGSPEPGRRGQLNLRYLTSTYATGNSQEFSGIW